MSTSRLARYRTRVGAGAAETASGSKAAGPSRSLKTPTAGLTTGKNRTADDAGRKKTVQSVAPNKVKVGDDGDDDDVKLPLDLSGSSSSSSPSSSKAAQLKPAKQQGTKGRASPKSSSSTHKGSSLPTVSSPLSKSRTSGLASKIPGRKTGGTSNLASSSPELGGSRLLTKRMGTPGNSGSQELLDNSAIDPDGHPAIHHSLVLGPEDRSSMISRSAAAAPAHLNRSSPSVLDSGALSLDMHDNIDRINDSMDKYRGISSKFRTPVPLSYNGLHGNGSVSSSLHSVISDSSIDSDYANMDKQLHAEDADVVGDGNDVDGDCDRAAEQPIDLSNNSLEQVEMAPIQDNVLNPLEVCPEQTPVSLEASPEDLSPINAFDQDSGNETGMDDSQSQSHPMEASRCQAGMLDSFAGMLDSFHGTDDSLDGLSAPSEDQGLASSMEGELDDRGINSTIQVCVAINNLNPDRIPSHCHLWIPQ